MEERILDEDENRGIRLKKTEDGEIDAVEGFDDGEEAVFEFPEEYDESLAGLSQAQVEEELARRKKAMEEAEAARKQLLEEGQSLLGQQDFAAAEEKFAQAFAYDAEDHAAAEGLFTAATKNFTDPERLYRPERAEDIENSAWGRKFLREKFGEPLEAERKRYREEIDSLRPSVEEKQAERREAFAANKKHYVIFTCIALALAAVFAIATAIAADNLFKNSVVPLALTVVFGILTFCSVTMLAVMGARLYGANKLCKENEKTGSTKDGARLEELYGRMETLDAVLSEDGPEA